MYKLSGMLPRWVGIVGLGILLSQCAFQYTHPTSRKPGDDSPYTGKPWRLPAILTPEVFFAQWPSEQAYFYAGPETRNIKVNPLILFGFLPIPGMEGRFLDQTEVPIVAYREFLYYASRDSADWRQWRPTLNPQLDTLYQSNPRFVFHSVVGVSKSSAEAYCSWRQSIINARIESEIAGGNTRFMKEDQRLQVSLRLPTEQEWEVAASGGLDTARYPYGYSTLLERPDFDEATYTFLQDRFGVNLTVEQIELELEAYQLSNNKMPVFHIWWPYAPEILQLPVPAYVYAFQPNPYGFYHLIGNVREWVSDSPLSKGGAFPDPLTTIKLQDGVVEPEPESYFVGFRCACEASYVPTE